MPKIRVLIVDDSAVMRRLLSDLLTEDPQIEVAGLAGDGQTALTKIQQLKPDLVTLDMEMPVMDGLDTLRALRKIHQRLPVIMFSTLTERGSCATLDALALGASDYVTKPANVGSVMASMNKIREDLIPKIKALCLRNPAFALPAAIPLAPSPSVSLPLGSKSQPLPSPFPTTPNSPVSRPVIQRKPGRTHAPEILAVGVSTGGPNALAEFIPALGRHFPIPIVIVQHMPPLFTRLLAERIASVSGMTCREGVAGEILRPGEAWVAPGGFHMEVESCLQGARLRMHEDPPENSCRPAVDVLFRSVAKVYGSGTLAVVLTGMGQDGLKGSEVIRTAGGSILAQDEASSVVWGMPGAVATAGLAEKVLPLHDLASEVLSRVQPHFQISSGQPAAHSHP
jgi:two-component system chemotaxis response regulator CheB